MSAARQESKPTATQDRAKAAAEAAFEGSTAVLPDGMLRKSRRSMAAILIGILAVQIVSPATVIILVAGMLPSVVAYVVDAEPGRRSAHCMAVLNLAGVLPVLATLWDRGATRGAAADILVDPFMWLLMYGAAGVAVILLTMLPVMMEQLSNVAAEKEIVRLEKQMDELVEEWGGDLVQEVGRLDPGEQPALFGDAAPDRPASVNRNVNTAGRASISPKGAVRERRPSSPSAASRRPGPRSGAPVRG